MSKIGILTFLYNGNYGSCLQAFALQRALQGMGYDCEHINYKPDNREKVLNMLRCGNSPKLLMEGFKKKSIKKQQEGLREKDQRILDFYQENMKLSALCRNRNELKSISREYDILLCGSDQIWNPTWLNTAYFLDFADAERKRIAYAASLGVNRVPARRKQRMIRRRLSLFDAVSVREEEGAKVLVSITGNRPCVMPDPVCLMTKEEWAAVAGKANEAAPYLLCYFIGENPKYWERVKQLQAETDLPALVIPVTEESYSKSEMGLLDGAGPKEFLRAIQGASLICTDSFHGLAFGTIFQKRVELIPRDRPDSREIRNSRAENFCREIHKKGLTQMREEGLAWLREQIEIPE